MPRILIWLLITVNCVLITVQAQTCLDDVAPVTPTAEFTLHADGTVTHSRTALVWDRCPLGQSGANCEQGSTAEYTWEQALQQVEIANQNAYKGHTDWRLPTKRELVSIVEYQCYSPAINEAIFPDTQNSSFSSFWSGSPHAYYFDYAWYVVFNDGSAGSNSPNISRHVRLVRGGQSFGPLPDETPQSCNNGITSLPAEFDIHADGTTTHLRTALIWDRCAYGQQGAECGDGEAATYAWDDALQVPAEANRRAYKGYSDWRLPTIAELQTITEELCWDPALNTTVFPATSSVIIWSGSPHAYGSDYAWYVSFGNGDDSYDHRDDSRHVRLVRGGQSFSPLPAPNQAPSAAFSLDPAGGTAPLAITLDATDSSDPEGTPLSYTWTINGQAFGGNSVQIGNTFAPGEYTLALTVSDGDLSAQAAPQTLSVAYPPPPAIPPALALYTGQTQTVSARTDAPPLTWTSSDPAIATVATDGTVSARAAGGVSLTVTDAYGQSASMTVQVSAAADDDDAGLGYALIIAGGGAHQQNQALFEFTHELSTAMYRLLHDRGLGHDEILFLTPREPDSDGDGRPNPEHRDFLLLNPASDLAEAFRRAAATLKAGQQFVFYFHGHGAPEQLKVSRNYALSAAQLRTWLDSLPADGEQLIILDSCYSGSLLDDLAAPRRTVLAATDAESLSWETRVTSFSRMLIDELRRGDSVNAAFQRATDTVHNNPLFRDQQPQLDDDGDGVFTGRDGRRAANLYLVGEGPSKAEAPDITFSHDRLELAAGSSREVLWVKTYPQQLRKVRALLTSPGLQTPDYAGENTALPALESLEMGWNPVQEQYEAVYEGFFTPGVWRIYYQAEGMDGLRSDIIPGEVQAGGVDGAALQAGVNLSRYRPGDRFRFNITVSGTRTVDIYAALVFPEGFFMTVSYPYTFNLPNTLVPYLREVALSGSEVYPVFDITLPEGLTPGNYAGCGVLTAAGDAPRLDAGNWLAWECVGFGME